MYCVYCFFFAWPTSETDSALCKKLEFNMMLGHSSLTKNFSKGPIFTCYIKTVPVYDFKLVWVVLHLPVKNFSKRFTDKSKIMMLYS